LSVPLGTNDSGTVTVTVSALTPESLKRRPSAVMLKPLVAPGLKVMEKGSRATVPLTCPSVPNRTVRAVSVAPPNEAGRVSVAVTVRRAGSAWR